MIAKIGNRLIASLTAQEKPYRVQDTELKRFFLRVQPSGVMTYGCDVELPDGRRTTRIIGRHGVFTAAQARDEARKILGDVARGIDPADAKRKAKEFTLSSFLSEKYGPWLRARQKRGDGILDAKAEARAQATLKMIETTFGEFLPKRIGDLNPWVIEKWKMEALNDGAKPSTINRKLDALRASMSKAVRWGLLPKNPLSNVEWCELDDNGIVRFLTDEEAIALEDALVARDDLIRAERRRANQWRSERGYDLLPDLDSVAFADHLTPMVRLSRNLGVRRGELFQIERKHVDLDRRTVTIIGDNSKNGKTRHIPLNRVAFETLSAWINQHQITHGLIFPGAGGRPMNNVNKSWNGVLAAARIENFRWHDQRHDFASRLVMSGVDLNTVRELLGHADIKMTLRYAHLAPRVKAEAVARLDGPSASVLPMRAAQAVEA
jgi:integrase